ncbi:MAG: NHL repeat-containing protein [bacterium]
MKTKIVFILIFVYQLIFSQIVELDKKIGKFSKAGSFSLVHSGYIYVSDRDNDEVYKMDFDGIIIKQIGGYGWDIGLFDEPVDVFANELNVYIADKNNDRIQILDRELNFLSEFKTNNKESESYTFVKPTCFAISNQSDLLVLDSYNNRILKYDLTGRFLQEIGNYDSGEYSLSNPVKFAISPDGKIFVVNDDVIFVFDQYGNGIAKLDIGFNATGIKIFETILSLNNDKLIKSIDLRDINSDFIEYKLEEDISILETFISNNKLFVLTKNTVYVYNIL